MKRLLISALGLILMTGCAATRPRTMEENRAYMKARNAVVITNNEPNNCEYISGEEAESWDYNGALDYLRGSAADIGANTVVIDDVEDSYALGQKTVRVIARLLECPGR